MSERKRRFTNWVAICGWLIFIAWLSFYLWLGISQVGTVDCKGNTTTWIVILVGCWLFAMLFIAGFYVGTPNNRPGGKGDLVDRIESIYYKLDSDSRAKADEFIQTLLHRQ